jgi:hypothetical protein
VRVGIAVAIVGMVGLGVVTLWLAQPGRTQSRNSVRACTAAFLAAVVTTFALSASQWSPAGATVNNAPVTTASLAEVVALVKASNAITRLPADLNPSISIALTKPDSNWGGSKGGTCGAALDQSTVPACVFGDTTASRTIVIYGDSHAQMWFDVIDDLAIKARWKLVLLSKGACPAAPITGHLAETTGAAPACTAWHPYALRRINSLDPDLLVITQEAYEKADGTQYTKSQWQRELSSLLSEAHAKRTVVLGNIPSSLGPGCLQHKTVRACSTKRDAPVHRFVSAEEAAARAAGDGYINTTSWFCAARCSPVIGHFDVYFDQAHVALGYSEYLEGVLGKALGI